MLEMLSLPHNKLDAFLQKRTRILEKISNYLILSPVIKYSQVYENLKTPQNAINL